MAQQSFEIIIRAEDYIKSDRASNNPNVLSEPVEQQTAEQNAEKQITKKPYGTAEERFKAAAPKEPKEISPQLKQAGAALIAGTAATVISNVQTITGSQVAQNKVNNAVKVVGMAALAVKNPILAGITFATIIASNALKYAKETRDWAIEEQRNSERIGIVASQRGRL